MPKRAAAPKPKLSLVTQEPEVDYTEYIERDGRGRLVTDTIRVAIVFKKRHDNVLKIIAARLAHPDPRVREFWLLHLEERDYVDSRGKAQRCYLMTEDGFTILTMSFTGAEAEVFKIEYIKAFRKLEQSYNELRAAMLGQRDTVKLEDGRSFRVAQIHGKGLWQRRQEKKLFKGLMERIVGTEVWTQLKLPFEP